MERNKSRSRAAASKMTGMTSGSAGGGGGGGLLEKVGSGFGSLRGSPSELWKAYVLKFLDSYAYFSFSIVMTLFLSADFGFSDVEAGIIYGAWGALITVYGLFAGCIVDNLGVARSLRLGFVISLISRIFIFVTTSRKVLLANLCLLLPMGNCLGIPVLTTGIRRYTNESNRGFAFGLFYVIMNVAALTSGPVVDMLTIWYKGEDKDAGEGNAEGGGDDSASDGEWSFTSYRAIILTGLVANVMACLVTLTVREIKIDNTVQSPRIDDEGRSIAPTGKVSTFVPAKASAVEICRETFRTQAFWRFLVVCLITLNVRMIFRHLDATLPKYMMREFGENTPKGTIYSINPALIIVLVPLVTAATSDVDPLLMIHHGTYISAASVLFLAFSTSIWACVMFVVTLSIGEAVWSPRLYDYTMSIAKEGREGTYMALSSAPLFLVKLPVGMMSGYLLQKYCPEEGPRNSQMMWRIIGAITASSPILLTLLWGYVSKKNTDRGREEYTELTTVLRDNEVTPSNVRNGETA